MIALKVLTTENFSKFDQFFKEVVPYLKKLQFNLNSNGVSTKRFCVDVGRSKRSTGFIGYLANIESLRYLYEHYVRSGKIPKLATFYLSQDPLETLFGRIRSLLGDARNPTLEQFTGALRKVMTNNDIKSTSSCTNVVDSSNIMIVSSTSKTKTQSNTNRAAENPHDLDISSDSESESSSQSESENEMYEQDTESENDDLIPYFDSGNKTDSDDDAEMDEV